jgi:hypothetical protein
MNQVDLAPEYSCSGVNSNDSIFHDYFKENYFKENYFKEN